MMITICLAIAILSLLALHVALQCNKARRMINRIPGPKPLPIIGNLLMFNVSLEQLWNVIRQTLDKYYLIVKIWWGTLNIILLRHPDDMKALLSCKKNIDKSDLVYGTIRSIGNDGIIVNGGDKWRQRRKLIVPAFNHKLMKVYFDIINEHTEQLVNRIKSQNAKITLDLQSTLSKHTLAVVCEATMGVNPNDFGVEKEKEFRHDFHEIGQIIVTRATRPYLQDWMMKFLSLGRKQECVLKRGRDFINEIIQERREYYEKFGYDNFQSMVDDDDDVHFSSTLLAQRKRLSVLDLLLAAENENLIDDRGVREEAETILLAGYDTASIAMTFVLMLLAEHKTVQEVARKEVSELLNQTNGVLTMANINKLEYLDRCIKETLRLYPSAPYIARTITDDIKLSNFEIPHNTQALMSIYSTHHDSNFWPDPEKFDPDRFLPENIKERHPFAFLPFSAGPRSCIGQKFAMLEIKVMVARILYNFYMEPVDLTANMKFRSNITLLVVNQCRVKLIKINRESSALCD